MGPIGVCRGARGAGVSFAHPPPRRRLFALVAFFASLLPSLPPHPGGASELSAPQLATGAGLGGGTVRVPGTGGYRVA